MAKTKWVTNTVEWGGNFSTLWGLLPAAWQTLVTGGLTALTALFSSREVGIGQAIFYSSGVLAFGMTTVFLSIRISQLLGMFQRLSVASIGVSSATVNNKNNPTQIDHINLFFVLRNDSQRPMFYRLKRIKHHLGRQTPVNDQVSDGIVIIPAFGGIQTVSLATIEKVPLSKRGADGSPPLGPTGTIEVDVEYGADKDDLNYHLHWLSDLSVGLAIPIGLKEMRVELGSTLKLLEHTKK